MLLHDMIWPSEGWLEVAQLNQEGCFQIPFEDVEEFEVEEGEEAKEDKEEKEEEEEEEAGTCIHILILDVFIFNFSNWWFHIL